MAHGEDIAIGEIYDKLMPNASPDMRQAAIGPNWMPKPPIAMPLPPPSN
jgi:hypothetical protein